MESYSGKIRNVALILLLLAIIGFIIIAIALWATEETVRIGYHTETVHPYVWQGFGVLIGGSFSAFVFYYLMMGFAEMVENTDNIVFYIEKSMERREKRKEKGEEKALATKVEDKPRAVRGSKVAQEYNVT